MPEKHSFVELLQQDQRYHAEAYQFVREALVYAQDVMKIPGSRGSGIEEGRENHISGQQFCEAIRQFAVEHFGFMAKTVLNCWGVYSTADFGEIVYNLIRIKQMRKSDSDRREDFDNVYDFDSAFDPVFEHTSSNHG